MAPMSASALDFLRFDPDDPMPDVAIRDRFGIGIWLSDPDISNDAVINNGACVACEGDLPYPVPCWFPPPDPDWDMERLISCDWEEIELPASSGQAMLSDASCLAKLQRWLISPLVTGNWLSWQPELFASCLRGLIVRRTVLASETLHFLAVTRFCDPSSGPTVDKGVWWTLNTTNLDKLIRIANTELGLARSHVFRGLGQWAGVAGHLVATASKKFGSKSRQYLAIESIVCLGHLIVQHLSFGLLYVSTESDQMAMDVSNFWELPELVLAIVHEMEGRGWCRYAITKLIRRTTLGNVFSLVHSRARGGALGDHSRCNHQGCVQEMMLEQPTRHRRTYGGACGDWLKLPHEELIAALTIGQTPLVAVDRQEGQVQTTTIRVVVHEAHSFVAFSHVWSQGRGSTSELGLPPCHVDNLASICRQITPSPSEPVYFWIDSLCIPQAPEIRKIAISGMRTVYAAAKQVIVLDDTLDDDETLREASVDLLLTRILASPWSNRLWTFQEGLLSKRLVFQIGGRPLELSKKQDGFLPITPSASHASPKAAGPAIMSLVVPLRWLFETSIRPMGPEDRIVPACRIIYPGILRELTWRRTKNPEDETTAIYAASGLPTGRLNEILRYNLLELKILLYQWHVLLVNTKVLTC